MVLDGLPGLYGFKYDSATACGTPLYLYSYKLVGSTTPMLAWSPPFSNVLALDQTIANKLAKLVFGRCQSWPSLLSTPHGHELLVFDHGKG